MKDEQINDPQVTIHGPECTTCKGPLDEKQWVPDHGGPRPYKPVCSTCYSAYVKAKYGSGNRNPDELPIA